MSTATPIPLPVRRLDFVAPYWFDDALFLNNTGNASNKTETTVYYRETNNSVLLTRATREIRKTFATASKFIATHLFIVTWIINDPENDLSMVISIANHLKYITIFYFS